MLTEGVADSSTFAKLFGIASINDYSAASAHYKYSASQLGKELGGNTWHVANKLIQKLKDENGFDMRAADSVYHRTEMVNKTPFHKYSQEAVELLIKVRDGDAYEVRES
jgi:hypothetical protein